MSPIVKIVFILVLVGVIGGGAFLANSQIPSPVTKIEKVLPDDRFPR